MVEREPRNVAAPFSYVVNTARWGQTKEVVQSLFPLPTVQEEIQIILDLDPKFITCSGVSCNVFYEAATLRGGDLKKAEEMFQKGLEADRVSCPVLNMCMTSLPAGTRCAAQNNLNPDIGHAARLMAR